ncbi:hypothetical protein B0H11DRAFT_2234738 [Mycena galericulata]|nr:hypothetical protein B0H11DRAFT_2234738 [Mycena galericulata]
MDGSKFVSVLSTRIWSLYTAGVTGLTQEFPNGASEHGGFIDFTETETRYIFRYAFIHALPVQAWESLNLTSPAPLAHWKDVGYVELDRRVYLDTHLVDGEVMLRLMTNSVQNGYAVRWASRVEAPLSPACAPSLWNVETLEASSAMAGGEGLVLELGKRLFG